MNNVYVMTARQDQQLGYALDSQWYGIGEFTGFMRKALQKLTRDEVNAAVKRHLDARNLSVVFVTKDAAGLKQALASDAFSPIRYDGEKPADVLAEDKVIGAMKLRIPDRERHRDADRAGLREVSLRKTRTDYRAVDSAAQGSKAVDMIVSPGKVERSTSRGGIDTPEESMTTRTIGSLTNS